MTCSSPSPTSHIASYSSTPSITATPVTITAHPIPPKAQTPTQRPTPPLPKSATPPTTSRYAAAAEKAMHDVASVKSKYSEPSRNRPRSQQQSSHQSSHQQSSSQQALQQSTSQASLSRYVHRFGCYFYVRVWKHTSAALHFSSTFF